MCNHLTRWITAVLLTCCAPMLSAEQVIAKFSGSHSTMTPEFEVRAPWILEWQVAGELSRVVAVDVALFSAGTGVHEGTVLKTKTAGNGVKLFDQSGRFYFRVDATMMNWYLSVIQLTPEEAELYTPKARHMLDQ